MYVNCTRDNTQAVCDVVTASHLKSALSQLGFSVFCRDADAERPTASAAAASASRHACHWRGHCMCCGNGATGYITCATTRECLRCQRDRRSNIGRGRRGSNADARLVVVVASQPVAAATQQLFEETRVRRRGEARPLHRRERGRGGMDMS